MSAIALVAALLVWSVLPFMLGVAVGYRACQRAWERIMDRARARLREEHELARGGPYRVPEPVIVADLDALDNAPLPAHPPIEFTE